MRWRLKRWKFARRSEQLNVTQHHLFEETLVADLEAIGLELEALKQARTRPKQTPRRMPLPAELPRTEIAHVFADALEGTVHPEVVPRPWRSPHPTRTLRKR